MAVQWYDVLLAARRLTAKDRPITAETLAVESGITGTEKSKPSDITAAWLNKFHLWGYVRHDGGRNEGFKIWVLTKWGTNFRPKEESRGRKK
jgi:hypothetical protein